MSCDIRKYNSMDLGGRDHREMTLTAFVGGEQGHCIQFTIENSYCALSQEALQDLMRVISLRLKCKDGYTATGVEREDIEFHGV